MLVSPVTVSVPVVTVTVKVPSVAPPANQGGFTKTSCQMVCGPNITLGMGITAFAGE